MTMPYDNTQLQGLLLLAQDRRPDSRAQLATRMGDIILGTDLGAMSSRERELAEEILQRLLHQLEMPIRRSLAERLAQESAAPRALIVQLANDRIEVAWSVLLHSGLLDDTELLSVIRSRTIQHRLAIARREKISEPVSNALVRPGEHDVVRAVLENRGAAIAAGTFEILVENSQTDGDLQEFLLKRDDLDPRLAGRMYGWVSAALRHYIVDNFEIDHFVLDKAIAEALADVVGDQYRTAALDGTLQRIRFAVDRNEVQDLKMLLPLIRAGERSLFEALFAKLTGISVATSRRCLYEPGGRLLAIACRGCYIEKALFTEFFIALRQLGDESGAKIDPGELFQALSFYDRVDQTAAESRVAAWRRGETRGPLGEDVGLTGPIQVPSPVEGPTRRMYAARDRGPAPLGRLN